MSRWFLVSNIGYGTRIEVAGVLVLVFSGLWYTQRAFYSYMPPVAKPKLCGWHIFQITSRFHIALRSYRGAQ